jgi:diguanylate cyclase (GGDEF)-like protein
LSFKKRLCSILGLIGLVALQSWADNTQYHQYIQDRWSVKDGLLQVVGTAITQDQQGYIWIASQIGLSRFDGIHFKHFTAESIPHLEGQIESLMVDNQGRLWIGSNRGLQVKQGSVFSPIFNTFDGDNSYTPQNIKNIIQLKNGSIMVTSQGGLFSVEPEQYKLKRIGHNESATYGLLADEQGYWVGGLGKVSFYDGDKKRDYSLLLPRNSGNKPTDASNFDPKTKPRQAVRVEHLIAYQDTILAGTTEGVFRLQDDEFVPFELASERARPAVESMMVDTSGGLWISTNLGLYHRLGEEVNEFIANSQSNAFKVIMSMFEDREKNLWFGSYADGIARLRKGSTRKFGVESGLSDPLVWSLTVANDGGLWIGTNSGLEHFYQGRYQAVVDASQLPHPVIYTMMVDQQKLLLGTRAGVAIYEAGVIHQPDVFEPMRQSQIRTMVVDEISANKSSSSLSSNPVLNSNSNSNQTRGYFFGSDNGLFHYDGKTLEHYKKSESDKNIAVRYLKMTRDKQLLIGAEDGVYHFENQIIKKISPQFLGKDSHVTFIYEADDGVILFGTTTDGLLYLKGDQWLRFTDKNGSLPTPGGFFIAQDNNKQLWISSFNGLYTLPYANVAEFIAGKRENLGARHVLSDTGRSPGTEISQCCTGAGTAKGLLQANQLTLPSRLGIIQLNTDKLHHNHVPPVSVIESVKYLNQWHEVDALIYAQSQTETPTFANKSHKEINQKKTKLVIPSKGRDITFGITALSFQDPFNLQIRYKLEGYDDDWRNLENISQRHALYTNLPAGEYRFILQSANNSNVWEAYPVSLDFVISAYIYETWLFRVTATVLIIFMLVVIFNWRVKRLTQKQLALQIEVAKRTQELSIANQKLLEISNTDPLTKLNNRRYLHDQIAKDIANFNRLKLTGNNQEITMALLLLDVDHFKKINDQYGHAAGDEVLKALGSLLKQQSREDDYIVRWGGEEFLIVSRYNHRSAIGTIVARLSDAIANANLSAVIGSEQVITCSIGYALLPFNPENDVIDLTWQEAVDLADKALYQVKANGRNGWASYQFDVSVNPEVENNTEASVDKNTETNLNASTINNNDLNYQGLPCKLIASWLE